MENLPILSRHKPVPRFARMDCVGIDGCNQVQGVSASGANLPASRKMVVPRGKLGLHYSLHY